MLGLDALEGLTSKEPGMRILSLGQDCLGLGQFPTVNSQLVELVYTCNCPLWCPLLGGGLTQRLEITAKFAR